MIDNVIKIMLYCYCCNAIVVMILLYLCCYNHIAIKKDLDSKAIGTIFGWQFIHSDSGREISRDPYNLRSQEFGSSATPAFKYFVVPSAF